MSTHHARCVVCDEDCYCTSDDNWWFDCGINGRFVKPRALCSYDCAEALMSELRERYNEMLAVAAGRDEET